MGLFDKLGLDQSQISIDWDLKPADTFGMFESWGGKERVRNRSERFYYFYIDGWQRPARLCLMERGIKYAKVLALIKAPQDLIDACMAEQGKSTTLDTAYAINDPLRQWLQGHVIDGKDDALITSLAGEANKGPVSTGLPGLDEPLPAIAQVTLRSEPCIYHEEQLELLVRGKNLFDRDINPEGGFPAFLVDNGDDLTVTDMVTGLMWQRGGSDINSIRSIQNWVIDLNEQKFAGYDDWRLPTTLEALSIVEKGRNAAGLHQHPCFSIEQPFIFTADQRRPGGYWFVDFTKGAAFWASGFNPGGFGRVCRSNAR